MSKITIEVDDKEVSKKLQEMQAATGNLRPAMEVIGRKVRAKINLGFRNGVSPFGEPWKPVKYRSGQPLRDTGRLQRSIGYRTESEAVNIGTNVIYGPIHQYGGTIVPKRYPFLVFQTPQGTVFAKKVRIPARPFLPVRGDRLDLPPEWANSVLSALGKHLGVA